MKQHRRKKRGNMRKFREFLKAEVDKRHISMRQFARESGIGHETINKYLDLSKTEVGYPAVETLVKLAKYTHTDIRYLISLVAPDAVIEPRPWAWKAVNRLEAFPKEKRDSLLRLMGWEDLIDTDGLDEDT